MQRWIAPMMALMLAGCGKPEVEGCEKFLKEGLKSPSSYKRVSVDAFDRPLSLSNFQNETGQRVSQFDRPLLMNNSNAKMRQVIIAYDADNSFGTAIRGTQVCAFKVFTDKSLDADKVEAAATKASMDRSMRQLFHQGAIPRLPNDMDPHPRYECCM